MFYPMRRSKQLLPAECTRRILAEGTSGVLALLDAEGWPYAVPLSYCYDEPNGRILFHGAVAGHKADAIAHCPRASFCVIGQDTVVPAEYTTRYRSVVAFGQVRLLTDAAEKQAAAALLAARYRPGHAAENAQTIADAFARMAVFALEIEHLTGKESMALHQAREAAE